MARPVTIAVNLVIALAVWFMARQGLIAPAILLIAIVELWPGEGTPSWQLLKPRATRLVVGFAFVIIIALLPKLISQVGAAALYAAWRLWQERFSKDGDLGMAKLLLVQVVVLESVFLAAAIGHIPGYLVLLLVWAGCFLTVRQALEERGERMAGLMAAVWGVTAAELSWIFVIWLVSYITPGNYLIVPQPVIVLGSLAYCLGSVYAAQRRQQLNKARLTEYLLLGLIIIWIVIAGTTWRGTL